jgi:hypothetical protein
MNKTQNQAYDKGYLDALTAAYFRIDYAIKNGSEINARGCLLTLEKMIEETR